MVTKQVRIKPVQSSSFPDTTSIGPFALLSFTVHIYWKDPKIEVDVPSKFLVIAQLEFKVTVEIHISLNDT